MKTPEAGDGIGAESIVILGIEGQNPQEISPIDTWSPDEGFIFDGQHVYDVATFSETSEMVVSHVRPVITKEFCVRVESPNEITWSPSDLHSRFRCTG